MPTTAAELAAFKAELEQVGFEPDLVHDLVRDAAHHLLNQSDVGLRLDEPPVVTQHEAHQLLARHNRRS